MPELPEVETVRQGLRPFLEGRRIQRVCLRRPNLRFPFPARFTEKLESQKIQTLTRRGKYLLIHLGTDQIWLIHLGMSGRFLMNPQIPSKHDHVFILLDSGKLVYRDPRRFGFMDLFPTQELDRNRWVQNLGIEPLSKDFTGAVLRASFTGKKMPLKNLLLRQDLIAGMGNIYACEALFLAELDPQKPGHSLGIREFSRLTDAIKSVLKKAIKAGGASLKDRQRVTGELGYFQHQFKVYGRLGQPCTKCSTDIQKITQSGRSTFFCPACQQ